jgi:hypothetical protein
VPKVEVRVTAEQHALLKGLAQREGLLKTSRLVKSRIPEVFPKQKPPVKR